MRYFKYTGEPMNTRGEYGNVLRGGHTRDEDDRPIWDDGSTIWVDDSDFGPMDWASESDADFVEVSEQEWRAL
jgi:hypothetical protein